MADILITEASNSIAGLDFSTLSAEDAAITSRTATSITATVEQLTVVFTGAFTYDDNGNPATSSLLNALTLISNGELLIEATDLGLTFSELQSGDLTAALEAAMTGNDTYTSFWNDGEVISTYAGNDTVQAGSGDDTIQAGDGHDKVNAGDGNDALSGGFGRDRLSGERGNDEIFGNHDDDVLLGKHGNDTLNGGNGDDQLFGGAGRDWLFGTAGEDFLDGGAHHDRLSGGSENDILRGGTGNDTLRGDDGNDFLSGGSGSDKLKGGNGNDRLKGNSGSDTLFGQFGDDKLTGGSHADVFVFNTGGGDDTITDFEAGLDQIQIAGGASGLGDLTFSVQGSDVLVSFANTTILVENTNLAALQDADNSCFKPLRPNSF
ncbi:calcium-binding protein [Leisingera sp. ANG-Vp]|uniref:calcium-binding protein n=1 Tax=Leisingera sp. ANG-Vp TaxID=1577896 RepID=UPI00068F2FED|nr:calcium-binding protein [Leisingera sp. ANG-Vp]